MFTNRHFLYIVVLILLGLTFVTNFAFAWEVTWPEIPGTEFVIGQRCPGGCPPADLPGFIAYIFTLALVSAGIVALGMLVWGAVQFVASAGFPSMRTEARNRMTGAVVGLLLLLATYVILNTINPELVMPGLGLAPGNFDASNVDPIEGVITDGVFLYENDNCDTSQHWVRYTQAEKKLDGHMNNKAKAFKFLDNGAIVNFYDGENFSGQQLSIEGPTGDCIKFSADFLPDLTEKVSSLNFEQWPPGATLCKYPRPSDKAGDCDYLSYTKGGYAEKVTYRHGSANLLCGLPTASLITTLTPGYYDLGNPPRTVGVDAANWIGVAPGYYGVLCEDSNGTALDNDTFCYFVLETTSLGLYGDRFCAFAVLSTPALPATAGGADTVVIEKSQDRYCEGKSDCRSCKGVIFYTADYFNREVFGWPVLSQETAAWPIGLDNISQGAGPVDIMTGVEYFTRIDDLNQFDEVSLGGLPGGPSTPDISSLKLIGNCKLKVSDQINLGAPETYVFTKNVLKLINVTRGAGPATWNDAIRSFIICNAKDMVAPCNF